MMLKDDNEDAQKYKSLLPVWDEESSNKNRVSVLYLATERNLTEFVKVAAEMYPGNLYVDNRVKIKNEDGIFEKQMLRPIEIALTKRNVNTSVLLLEVMDNKE